LLFVTPVPQSLSDEVIPIAGRFDLSDRILAAEHCSSAWHAGCQYLQAESAASQGSNLSEIGIRPALRWLATPRPHLGFSARLNGHTSKGFSLADSGQLVASTTRR
jgi:hypothetical protein